MRFRPILLTQGSLATALVLQSPPLSWEPAPGGCEQASLSPVASEAVVGRSLSRVPGQSRTSVRPSQWAAQGRVWAGACRVLPCSGEDALHLPGQLEVSRAQTGSCPSPLCPTSFLSRGGWGEDGYSHADSDGLGFDKSLETSIS